MAIYVDPHIEDRIFTPVFFKLLGYRSTKKYEYLRDIIKVDNTFHFHFTNENSSFLSNKRAKFIPKFLKYILIKLEIKAWLFYNEIENYKIHNEASNSVFFFITKKSNLIKRFNENERIEKIFVHLSHYHNEPEIDVSRYSKLEFCFDFNISDDVYFSQKYKGYKKKIKLMPFSIQNKFFEVELSQFSKRENRISLIGSYHKFDPKKRDFGIYSFDKKFCTLHPIRLQLGDTKFNKNVDNRISQVNQGSILKSLSRNKKYYGFDIIKFYSQTEFIVCPGEGNGALGISVLEALAMGCGVIISKDEHVKLKLNKIDGIFTYNNYDELVQKINDISKGQKIKVDRNALRNFAKKYSSHNLTKTVNF